MHTISKSRINEISHEIIGSAIEVHRQLGPGLLESIYQKCLSIELLDRGLSVREECRAPVIYNNRLIETSLRLDLLVENSIVIELKAVQDILPVHKAQLLTYMKLLNAPKGFLFNFNCMNICREGQKIFLGERYKHLPE
jgi:GxxExxY protein